MKKMFSLFLKALPLLTLYHAMSGSGARLGPFLTTAKVIFTQYEVSQITNLVIAHYNEDGSFVDPRDFSAFVFDKYHNQYSNLAREVAGDKEHKLYLDIWGTPYQMTPSQDLSTIVIVSLGPDKNLNTKDDIRVDFQTGLNTKKQKSFQASSREPASRSLRPTNDRIQYEYDADGFDRDGFDRDGFNRQGLDSDGYDRNGIHYTEQY